MDSDSVGCLDALSPRAAEPGGARMPLWAHQRAMLRRCLRDETRLRLVYADAAGATTERVVWPLALAYFESVQMLVAWCELRVDFRTFRMDRIHEATPVEGRFGRRRAVLLAEWRRREGIPAD